MNPTTRTLSDAITLGTQHYRDTVTALHCAMRLSILARQFGYPVKADWHHQRADRLDACASTAKTFLTAVLGVSYADVHRIQHEARTAGKAEGDRKAQAEGWATKVAA